jgi:hypothetical protein
MKNKIKYIAIIFAVAILVVTGCEEGSIPVLTTDVVDEFTLPQYTLPDAGSTASIFDRYQTYGTEGTRINPENLNIKYAYRTSDDVTHIVLRGDIDNGIPEGLLWDEDPAGTFGVPSGTYGGRGDFKAGTLNAATGGSAAIGSPNFSAEWVMADLYTAIVITGLIGNEPGTKVTEINDSLNLFSADYRKPPCPDGSFFSSPNGKLQKMNSYDYNPNNFHRWPDSDQNVPKPYNSNNGAPRGGYVILISKKAYPQTAFFDIEYSNGTKKRVEVDYNEVQLREEIPLTNISFQNPTPSYSQDIEGYTLGGTFPNYTATVAVSDITLAGDKAVNPLFLRPLYEPAMTTNMISSLSLTDDTTGVPLNNENLILKWDDSMQAITIYIKEGVTVEPMNVVIHAKLRLPFVNSGSEQPVFELTCTVTIQQSQAPS